MSLVLSVLSHRLGPEVQSILLVRSDPGYLAVRYHLSVLVFLAVRSILLDQWGLVFLADQWVLECLEVQSIRLGLSVLEYLAGQWVLVVLYHLLGPLVRWGPVLH